MNENKVLSPLLSHRREESLELDWRRLCSLECINFGVPSEEEKEKTLAPSTHKDNSGVHVSASDIVGLPDLGAYNRPFSYSRH